MKAPVVFPITFCLILISCGPRYVGNRFGELMRVSDKRIALVEPVVRLERMRSRNDFANEQLEQNALRVALSTGTDSFASMWKPVRVGLTAHTRKALAHSQAGRRVFRRGLPPRPGTIIGDSVFLSILAAAKAPLGIFFFIHGRYWARDSRPYTTIVSPYHAMSSSGRYGMGDTTQVLRVSVCVVGSGGEVLFSEGAERLHVGPDSAAVGAASAGVLSRFLAQARKWHD